MATLRLACVDALPPRLDDRDQRMAGVCGGDDVGRRRRTCDRGAEPSVRVAALPRVGERGRLLIPGAARRRAASRRTWPRPRSWVAPSMRGGPWLPRLGRRGSRRRSPYPWRRWRGRRSRASGRRPWRRACRSVSWRRGRTCSGRPPHRSGTTGTRSRSRLSPTSAGRAREPLAELTRPGHVGGPRLVGPVFWAVTTAGVATLTASCDAAPDARTDDGEERVPGVGGGDRVGARGRAADRLAESPIRVAALPLVPDRGRRRAPAAGRDLRASVPPWACR